MGYRISTDVGGTFTDLTIAKENELIGRYKSPSTPKNVSEGVFNALSLVAEDLGCSVPDLLKQTDLFVHGSTVATNAVLEGKVARCGVLCTEGMKYTLWRGEGRRKDIFNYKVQAPEPLVKPRYCLEVRERVDREGDVLVPLDEPMARAAIRQLRDMGCEAIAVCLLWSVRNPAHERRIGELIEEEWPGAAYSLSSDIQPVIKEYPRMSCVALNAMLKPVVERYLGGLERRLVDAQFTGELLIVTSDGGVVPVREVVERPVYLLFSGPSTGPSAGFYFGEREKERSCLVIDMGGTSFDVSTVVEGRITTTKDGRISNYPTGVSAVEILTLGAGGGSIASVDPAGMLLVGPRSAGADPGPVCYRRGGTEPTVTDAYVALGYIRPDRFLGGRMPIYAEDARAAIEEKIAKPLGLTVEQAALGICRVVNEKMMNGILDMTVRRGIDLRDIVLVTGGGATALAAGHMARELGVRRVIVPRETATLCAFGSLNADILLTSVASHPTTSQSFDFEGVNRTLSGLAERGSGFLDRLGIAADGRSAEFFAASRYPMQVTDLDIPFPDGQVDQSGLSTLMDDFHSTHKARYKTADPGSPVEFVGWRHVARGLTPKVALQSQAMNGVDASGAIMEMVPVYTEESAGFRDVPCYDATALVNGMQLSGPAIVIAPDTTVVVPPDAKVRMQDQGYMVMELGAH